MTFVPYQAWVLVADGRKSLLLRNEGDGQLLNLRRVSVEEHENPATHDQGTDQPGRLHGMNGAARSATQETDWHELEEQRFAATVAGKLNAAAGAKQFDDLIVVAPPRTLAELRKHWSKDLQDKLRAEVNKDLTSHPIPEIEKILAQKA